LTLDCFDGRSAQAQPAQIWLQDGALHVLTTQLQRHPVRAVHWPERQRHGQRQVLLPDGAVLSCTDSARWDAWARDSGLRDSLTVRWMQSWRGAGVAALLMLAFAFSLWRWGAPAAADVVVRWVPPALERSIGENALSQVDELWLQPSKLKAEQQQRLQERFAALVTASGQGATSYRLHFRAGPKAMGPNAFALPGGDIVLTDALVEFLSDQEDAVLGVLAHELGHVKHQHGLRLLVKSSLVGAMAGLMLGDFSSLLAGVPAVLANAGYSREAEREADRCARDTLRAGGLSPAVMAVFFERLQGLRKGKEGEGRFSVPSAIASHPDDEERRRFFSSPN